MCSSASDNKGTLLPCRNVYISDVEELARPVCEHGHVWKSSRQATTSHCCSIIGGINILDRRRQAR